MEVSLEIEDDLFFADLSRQLSLLLMDDNEEPLPRRPHVSLQAFSHVSHQQPTQPLVVHDHATAAVVAAYSGVVCKGTGVFIPRSVKPAKKQRRGRYNNIKARQFPMAIDMNSQVSNSNSLCPKKG